MLTKHKSGTKRKMTDITEEKKKKDCSSRDGKNDSCRKERYQFFYGTASPFSQWHPAKFTVKGIEYNCAEQYMMYQKAGMMKHFNGISLTGSGGVGWDTSPDFQHGCS